MDQQQRQEDLHCELLIMDGAFHTPLFGLE